MWADAGLDTMYTSVGVRHGIRGASYQAGHDTHTAVADIGDPTRPTPHRPHAHVIARLLPLAMVPLTPAGRPAALFSVLRYSKS